MATTNEQTWLGAGTVISTTGDKATFTPATPVRVLRVGVIGTATYTHGSGAIIKVDKNLSNGAGAYTRGDGDGGVLTVPAAFVNGKMVYTNVPPYELDPGDQLIFEVTQASTAGSVAYTVEYEKMGFQKGYMLPAKNHLRNTIKV